MAKLLKQSKQWTAETLLVQLRRTPIVIAAGVTEACVAHCQLILARLRLVTEQMKNAMKQLERLCSAVAELASSTESVGEGCRDSEILRSMPGVGQIVLAALLSEGYDAIARRDAQALRALAGVVPVTRRSGKQYMAVMRQACPHRLRTAVYHWARVAVLHDFHSRNRYSALRKRGHSHARALRSVGNRLVGVACAMLQKGELFDGARTPQPATA